MNLERHVRYPNWHVYLQKSRVRVHKAKQLQSALVASAIEGNGVYLATYIPFNVRSIKKTSAKDFT